MPTTAMSKHLSFLRDPEELYLEETRRQLKVKHQEIQSLRSTGYFSMKERVSGNPSFEQNETKSK